MPQDFFYEVDVERISIASSTVIVRAPDTTAALEAAKVLAARTRFKTDTQQYKPHNARPLPHSQPPEPDLKEAYREYVLKCAQDADFQIATLESYDTWRRSCAVEVLVDLFTTYVGTDDEELLDEHVHAVASQEGSAVNNQGWHAQIEYLYEHLGWDAARKALLDLAKPHEEWPEDPEPVSEIDESYDNNED
jgi:hypothetical protein